MKANPFKTALLFLIILSVGCSPVYYKANPMNVPNFRQKGEFSASGHLIVGGGGDVQAAYALTNHWAILASYMDASGNVKNTRTSATSASANGSLTEFGTGYFKPVGEVGAFALYGGYGFGKVQNDRNEKGVSSAKFNKIFIQPTFGWQWENFEAIVSGKLANVTYSELASTYADSTLVADFNALKTSKPILELGLTLRVGGERVKGQIQMIFAEPLVRDKNIFRYDGSTFGVGVCVQLGKNKVSK